MGEHRTINLNIVPLKQNKQHRKNYLDFHLRSDGLKIVGKKDDSLLLDILCMYLVKYQYRVEVLPLF